MFDQFVVTSRCDQFRAHEHFRRTVYEATRVGLLSCSTIVERETKAAAPAATSALVRNPARLCRHCRSAPMIAPNTKARAILKPKLTMDMVLLR